MVTASGGAAAMSDLDDIRVTGMEVGSGAMQDGYVHRKCIPFAIIVQATEGSYVVTGPEGAVTIHRHQVALVAADTPVAFAHHATPGGRMTARWLHVQAVWRAALDPCALYLTPHRIAGTSASRIGEMLGELVEHSSRDASMHASADGSGDGNDGLDRRIARIGLAYRVLGLALGSAARNPRATALLAAAARMGPLTSWLREHLREPLAIDDIARSAGLSRSRLHALFQEHLGVSPMAHLKELRLAAAAREILTTIDPLALVAERTGFANPFHFSREFSRRYGMSPRRYRDEQRLAFGS